jgi:hypothetical protein
LPRVTGLIYVGIIAVWAIVLVPAWLRRHDHLDPERSVDRFSRSMRTLGERPSLLGIPLPDRSERSHRDEDLEEPAPEVFRVSRPELARASARLSGAAATAGARVRSTSAAMRRRAVLGVLSGALAIVGGFVAVGVLLPVALVVPAGLIVAFLGLARSQVRAERARRARPAQRPEPIRPAQSFAAPGRPPAATADGTWEARATPLPSYVTAPPASEFPRVIDTATPGAWTAAAMLERAQQEKLRAERMAKAKAEAIAKAKAEQAAAEARGRDEDFLAAEAAQWQQRRRAVNE